MAQPGAGGFCAGNNIVFLAVDTQQNQIPVRCAALYYFCLCLLSIYLSKKKSAFCSKKQSHQSRKVKGREPLIGRVIYIIGTVSDHTTHTA
ncbi:hypothetical protein [Pelotomaculum sp. PtaB.Bin117]|uniref:hypothetical protein n=1 Tax=Pelotomaculum sp. PtaB.Bin117 TaxID=1811694 RepID=UPI0025805643|nr:hypothetical protein [Pelotomaculum sp. PtaB.Bin117]